MSSDQKFADRDDLLDDDKNTISLIDDSTDYDSIAYEHAARMDGKDGPTSPLLKGMNLDLSFAADGKDYDHHIGVQEQEVTVIFDLPDGSQGESVFKLGQTVEVLKSFIEDEYGIPMMEQELYLDERQLQNPFSLLDYPEAKGTEEIFVRVVGNLPKDAKK